MFESLKEYQNWENNRKDINPKDDKTPTIGLVLQRSHIVTEMMLITLLLFKNWNTEVREYYLSSVEV